MEKAYTIYSLLCPITNEIMYVGATSQSLKLRLRGHLKNAKNKKYKSKKDDWIRELSSKSLIPIISQLEIVNHESWQEKEMYWISYFRENNISILNQTDGGYGVKGYRHTEERKRELSQFFKGNDYRIGCKRTKYVWKNGEYIVSEDTKQKMSSSQIKVYEEGRRKLSSKSKGITTQVVQYTIGGIFVAEYLSTSDAARKTGIKRTTLTEHLRGKNQSSGGFIFKFKFPKEE